MSRLVRKPGTDEVLIQFQCGGCGQQYVTELSDIGTSFECDRCSSRANTLPVVCPHEDCGGR